MAKLNKEQKQKYIETKQLLDKSKNMFNIALTEEKIFDYGEIFLNLLSNYNDASNKKILHITESDIVRLLGIVNQDYYIFYNKIGELAYEMSKQEDFIFTREDIAQFYKKVHKNIKRIVFSIINDMFQVLEDEDVIRVTNHWEAISVEKPEVIYKIDSSKYQDDKDEYCYSKVYKKQKLSQEGLKKYLELVTLIKTEMGKGTCLTDQEICIANRWREFNFKLKKILAKEMKIMIPYKVYDIVFSPEGVKNKIKMIKEYKFYEDDLYNKYQSNNNKNLDYHISVAQVWGKKALTRKLNKKENKKLTQKEKDKIKSEMQIEQEKYIRFCYWVIMSRKNRKELEEYLDNLLYSKAYQNKQSQENIKKYKEYMKIYFCDELIEDENDYSEIINFIEEGT